MGTPPPPPSRAPSFDFFNAFCYIENAQAMALFGCFLLCYLGETTLIDFIYSSKSISNVCSTGPVINYSKRMQRGGGVCQILPTLKEGGRKVWR